MADQMIRFEWATGEQVCVSVELDDSYPDSVNEAEASCKRLFAYAMGVVRAYDEQAARDATPPLPPAES